MPFHEQPPIHSILTPPPTPTTPTNPPPGAIYPEAGALNKPDGRRVEEFGPVKNWSMTPPGPKDAAAGCTVRLTTQLGCYLLSRPAAAYKKVWAELQFQANLTAEILPLVDPAAGGNAAATFDEVVSRVARQKAVYKGYGSAREAILLNGRFVLQQLVAADDARRGVAASGKDKGKSAAGATEWAFYKGLEAEVREAAVGLIQWSLCCQRRCRMLLYLACMHHTTCCTGAAPSNLALTPPKPPPPPTQPLSWPRAPWPSAPSCRPAAASRSSTAPTAPPRPRPTTS
jgi:hypothetical protein